MKHLSELLEQFRSAQTAYVTSKSALDNSLDYLVRKEELRIARFEWLAACESYILGEVLIDE